MAGLHQLLELDQVEVEFLFEAAAPGADRVASACRVSTRHSLEKERPEGFKEGHGAEGGVVAVHYHQITVTFQTHPQIRV